MLAIERQKKRIAKLGKESIEFDGKALNAAKLGITLAMTRMQEIGHEVQARNAKRQRALTLQAQGMHVPKEDFYSAIRTNQLTELAQTIKTFQEVGMKSLGTNIEKLQVDAHMEAENSISVNEELARDDPGRLAGVLAVMGRVPEYAQMFKELGAGPDEFIDGELIAEDADDPGDDDDAESVSDGSLR